MARAWALRFGGTGDGRAQRGGRRGSRGQPPRHGAPPSSLQHVRQTHRGWYETDRGRTDLDRSASHA
ncbi:hypothetical protein U9M48_034680 [Paspalum notatum var. saurae]|uniref:Uncharacterized protein n=1 Tax=Paspalum notatum var. saurae TaxID=547442 RepID=A0AAQ3UDM2_PASNO